MELGWSNENKHDPMRGQSYGPKRVFTSRALVERAGRSLRADRDAPNESSAAQPRAELWPETDFCPYGALVERADSDCRVDRVAPNESSVAHI